MTRCAWFMFTLLTLGALLGAAPVHGQPATPTADAPASLSVLAAAPGRITIGALRTDGRPVSHIEPSWLLVREGDEILRPITTVDAVVDDTQQLFIIFVLDNSSAMTGTLRSQVHAALPKIAAALRPNDQLRIVSSGASPQRMFVEYPSKPDAATNADAGVAYLDRMLAAPAAAPGLDDAPIYDALSRLMPPARENNVRHLAIVISAGRRPSGIGRWNEYDAVAHAQRTAYPIFTFALSAGAGDGETDFLRRIAAGTNGEFARSIDDIVRVIDGMRTNFVVRYDSRMPNDWPAHRIEIVSLRDFGPYGRALAEPSSSNDFGGGSVIARIEAAHPTPEQHPTREPTTAPIVRKLQSIAFYADSQLKNPRWVHIAIASLIGSTVTFLLRWIVRELRWK